MWFIDAALTRAHWLRAIPRWTLFGGEGIGVQSVGRTELVWRVFISPKAILHGMWGLPDCFLIRRPHTWSARIFLKTRLLSPLPPTSRYTTSYSLLYNYFLWNLKSAVGTRSSVSKLSSEPIDVEVRRVAVPRVCVCKVVSNFAYRHTSMLPHNDYWFCQLVLNFWKRA